MHAKRVLSSFIAGMLTVSLVGLSLAEKDVPATAELHDHSELPLLLSQFEGEKHAAGSPIGVMPRKRGSQGKEVHKTNDDLLAVVRQSDIRAEDQVMADAIFRTLLPVQCHDVLQKLYVFYGPLKSRGYSSATTMIVQGTLETAEKRAIFLHETAHVLDLGCLTGNAGSGESGFRDGKEVIYKNDPSVLFYQISWLTENVQKAKSTRADFVSGYAASNVFEDLAESVTYYVVSPEAFRARAAKNAALKAKLAWIETYVFSGGRTLAVGKKWNGSIPWDATKLSYEWKLDGEKVAVR